MSLQEPQRVDCPGHVAAVFKQLNKVIIKTFVIVISALFLIDRIFYSCFDV